MNEYGQKSNTFIIILAILFLIGMAFVIFGGKMELTKNLYDKIFPNAKLNLLVNERKLIEPPANAKLWCSIQSIMVSTDNDEPISNKIIGWDTKENCCVQEIKGFDCAVKKDITLQYCFSGNIGGSVIYATVNGYYLDNTNDYKIVIDNLDKIDLNRDCVLDIYPEKAR